MGSFAQGPTLSLRTYFQTEPTLHITSLLLFCILGITSTDSNDLTVCKNICSGKGMFLYIGGGDGMKKSEEKSGGVFEIPMS